MRSFLSVLMLASVLLPLPGAAQDHSGHQAAPAATTETAPPAATEEDPMDAMHANMEAMEEKMKAARARMESMGQTLTQAAAAQGEARQTGLAGHRQAMREILAMMKELDAGMGGMKGGMMHGKDGGGMMMHGKDGDKGPAPGMKKMMKKHHQLMEDRMRLMAEMMEQMVAQMEALAAGSR